MRHKTLIGLLFVLAILAMREQARAQLTPRIVWEKCHGGGADDAAYSIVKTTDGGYAFAGFTRSQNDGEVTGHHGGEDGWVGKLDANGNLQWQKSLGGAATDSINCIIQSSDGGFVVAGETHSFDGDVTGYHGGGDAWVVKLDASGTIQWQKCLGGALEDVANSIIQSTDGGYVVAGETFSTDGDVSGNHGAGDAWVVKLNSTGTTVLWQRCLGGTSEDWAQSVVQTFDGGFVLAGTTESSNDDMPGNHGSYDVWVIKLNSTGTTILWKKCFGGTGNDEAYSIIQTLDSGFAIAGFTGSNDGDVSGNHGDVDEWVVKTDSIGNIQWQKCYGGTQFDQASSIVQTPDHGYALAGFTESNDNEVSGNHGGGDEWVVKLDTIGNILWQKCLGGAQYDQAFSIIQTLNGNYTVGGITASSDGDVTNKYGGEDAWIVELAPPVPPIISYITPDAGAPGMCVAVEIIGPDSNDFNFGNLGDEIYTFPDTLVTLTRPSDAKLVHLGPSIFSWNARMIQQMFMIQPHVGPIDTEIYFQVYANGVPSAVDSFHIVTPTHVGALSGGGTIPAAGRSKCNTLVVDSLILSNGTFTSPVNDPDPRRPGNQGYLPLRILSAGPITISNATLSADGASATTGTSGGNGGPGGGGGGSGYPGKGGDGFTGGGGDNDGTNGPGGNGSGYMISSHTYDGIGGLTGVVGGLGEQHSGINGDDGGGGGTGHPFGSSGQNGNNSSSPSGGYGAGSAGGSTNTYTINYGGGGGGYETVGAAGQGTGNNGGQIVGNPMLIPLAGGSGGGAGNQTYVSFFGSSKGGSGGGGGGAIELTSFGKLEALNGTISAQGGNGSNAVPTAETAAGGGGGSGGAISIDARDSIVIDKTSTFSVAGGQAGTSSNGNSGGKGGQGRIRISGFASKFASDTSKKYFLPQNGFAGPSIQRVTYTADSFYVHAHAEYWDTVPASPLKVEIYYNWPSMGLQWQSAFATFFPDNGSHSGGWIWGDTLSTNPIDTELYFVAVQQNVDASNPPYNYVAAYIMSHTSGIIAKVTGPPKVLTQPITINFGDVLVGTCLDTTIEVYSVGKSTLSIDSVKLIGVNASQFKIISPSSPFLSPGDSSAITIAFCPTSTICPANATLRIFTNDVSKDISLTGCGVQPQMIIKPLVLDFGRVHIGACKDSFITVSNPGKDPLTISRESIVDPRFKVLDPLPIIVPAGDSAKLDLEFCPTDTIIWHAIDSVIGNAPQSPVLVILNGEGKIGKLKLPKVLNFGAVHEGTCKDDTIFAVNIGNDSLLIESDPFTALGFSVISPPLPVMVPAQDSIPFDIRFCSADTGVFHDSLFVGTDIPSSDTVELLVFTGTGNLQIPDTIDFGSVATGGCADTIVQIKNVGNDTLVLAPDTNFKTPFSYLGSPKIVLAPGQVTTITLQFCPQDTNEATETTHFDTIGAGVNKRFTLRGKGIEGSLSTSGAIDLGCIIQGTAVKWTDTIRNTSKAALQNLLATVTPTGSASIVHNPPSTLAPGATDSVVLIIPASTLGPISGTLTLTSSNGDTIKEPITGQVSVPPAFTLTNPGDTILVFDSTNVNDTSGQKCIQVTNYSCIGLPIDKIFISGGLAGEFEIVSNNAPATLSDSATAIICLKYSPLQNGSSSATLFVSSNGNLIPLSKLSGFGIGKAVGVQLEIDTVAGRPGQIVNVPVRTLNDVTASSITSLTFRVSFNPMQLDMKPTIASTTSSIESSSAPTFTDSSYSIGDWKITATYPTPLTGKPVIAELPFEILQPTAHTAALHIVSASFGASLATLSTTSDGLIQIEQCDTNDLVALTPLPIIVKPNNPNPLSTHTAVTVIVQIAGYMKLEVYNALGNKVLVPFEGTVGIGTQSISIDASGLPSGAYHYITTWTSVGTDASGYQPPSVRDEKTMIVLGE